MRALQPLENQPVNLLVGNRSEIVEEVIAFGRIPKKGPAVPAPRIPT